MKITNNHLAKNLAQLLSPQIIFPFSEVQKTNCFLHELNPSALQDKVFLAGRISSEVNLVKIKNIFQQLIDRHASLRSKYQARDNRLLQEVRENAVLDFKKIDLYNSDLDELNRSLLDAVKQPFNLQENYLLRVRLFQRSAEDYILLITLHQLAGDRQSLFILLSEFLSLYNSEKLPPLNSNYQNYVTR